TGHGAGLAVYLPASTGIGRDVRLASSHAATSSGDFTSERRMPSTSLPVSAVLNGRSKTTERSCPGRRTRNGTFVRVRSATREAISCDHEALSRQAVFRYG